MVEVQQLFSIIGSFVNSLFSFEILGISIVQWYVVFWGLAIVGWALQLMYGTKGDK